LPGTEQALRDIASGKISSDASDISSLPPKTLASKLGGLAIPALIIALLGAGFFTGGAAASLDMLVRWLLWNGSLAAVGTILALGHPAAVLTAFVAAPVATINPFVGVGLFSGLAQAWARKPRVVDMETLATDAGSVKGFYRNRISHVLLVFFLSSLGGAIGNFIAVPALIGTLVK
ncbi:MAG TPA: TraB family protein, partial [Treponemataceae bacterium]|nr:TraB family protein [Treponemataceae bacterium]